MVELIGIEAGRLTLYFALCWTFYVLVKAIREIYKHWTGPFLGEEDPEAKQQHCKVHILYMIAVLAVCIGQIFSYIWFDIKAAATLEDDDRTIGVFNIFFINLLMLFLLNHFRHERKGTRESGTWKEILKL